jgi:hypothetical protein
MIFGPVELDGADGIICEFAFDATINVYTFEMILADHTLPDASDQPTVVRSVRRQIVANANERRTDAGGASGFYLEEPQGFDLRGVSSGGHALRWYLVLSFAAVAGTVYLMRYRPRKVEVLSGGDDLDFPDPKATFFDLSVADNLALDDDVSMSIINLIVIDNLGLGDDQQTGVLEV